MCVLYFKKRGQLWIMKNPQQYQEILRLKREKEMNKRLEKNPHLRLQQMIEQLKADRDKYLAERNQLQESLAEQGLFPPVALAPFGNISQV